MIELKYHARSIKLRESLFWDVEQGRLDARSSKMLIMERVLNRGSLEEFKQLIRFYSEEEFSETVVKIGNLDERTLNFISDNLNIQKQEFLCYRKKQSNPVHSNF